MNPNKNFARACALILTLASASLYIVPFFNEPIMVDEHLIITPLKEVDSLSGLISKYKAKEIYDLQPLRDLSHLLDIKIESLTGFKQAPLFNNLILLFAICALIFHIAGRYLNKKKACFLVSIFLFHPLVFHIFVEYTSRKHILSFLFVLLIIKLYLGTNFQGRANKVKGSFLFVFSCLSQPINIFLPVYTFILDLNRGKRIKEGLKNNLPLFITSFLFGIGNLYYFTFVFKEITGVSKITFFNPGEALLSLGRYFTQIFLPLNFSMFYFQGSVLSLIGLLLGVVLLYFTIKKLKPLHVLITWLPLLLIFFTLNYKVTNVFLFNTYLLTPLTCLLILLGFILKRIALKPSLMILPALLFSISLKYSLLRADPLNYFITSYEKEPTCQVLQSIVHYSMDEMDLNTFSSYSKEWLNRKCNYFNKKNVFLRNVILSHMILISPEFDKQKKHRFFEEKFINERDKHILFAATEILSKNSNSAKITEYLAFYSSVKKKTVFVSKGTFAGKIVVNHCQKFSEIKGCEDFLAYFKRMENEKFDVKYKLKIETPR